MPVSRSSSQPSTSPAEQVAAYGDRLFANGTGIVAVAIGVGGYFDQGNKYKFDTGNMRHRFFVWPEEREKVINLVVRSAKKHDVYVIPNLRSARSAKAGSSLGASYCWADIDRITDTSTRRLEALLSLDPPNYFWGTEEVVVSDRRSTPPTSFRDVTSD